MHMYYVVYVKPLHFVKIVRVLKYFDKMLSFKKILILFCICCVMYHVEFHIRKKYIKCYDR